MDWKDTAQILKIQLFWDGLSSLRSFLDSLILQTKPTQSIQQPVTTDQEMSL
jgi:hypothetical protein